jgi:hypothetical protein
LSLALRGLHDHDMVEQPKPKPAIDPEQEKRLKLEEARRQKIELELKRLKEELAKRAVAPPPPVRRPTPRIATIYRGLHNIQRVRTDLPAASELEAADAPLPQEPLDNRVSSLARGSPVVAAGDTKEP